MGQNQSALPGGPPGEKGKDDKNKKDKPKKWEPPLPTRVGKKKKKGPESTKNLPPVFPSTRCKLKLLKMERIKDYLLMEEEFVQNQERLKPQEEKALEERGKIDEIRGSPMFVGSLEEIIDDDHAIVSTSTGPEYYVSILSFVDKDLLEPGCSILIHYKNMAVVGVLADDADPMVSVMKLEKAPTESYADVGGLEQQVQEIKEAVELPLTHPELYEEMGIKPPKGVILYGVPGTGKTLLAKAVANQTSATFLRVVGSELIQKYLGDGPKLVRELFRVAEENAPSIVFIDEIDAVGTKRYDSQSGGEKEIQRTMLELLNQLDGFDSRGDVKVIMATNRIESLDPALIRPGRIDRKIEFPLPDIKTKRRIFNIHTGKMTLADDVDLEEFVMSKDDLSGADIKAICTEAGLFALRERRMRVIGEDFRKAKERSTICGKDFYKILGVAKSSTKKQIKKAYINLSKKFHPDKSEGNEKQFISVTEAYQVLSDDEKRRIYDQYGEEGLKQDNHQFTNPFDIFSRFGSTNRQQTEKKGPEVLITVEFTLEELFNGVNFDIELNKQVICPTCRGSGAKNDNDVKKCTVCNGSGVKIVKQMIAPGFYQQMQTTCDSCHGKGKIVKSTCPHCKGKKVKRGSREISFSLERGSFDGQKIVFDGEGDEHPDQSAGNLIFVIKQIPHNFFRREGENLYLKEIITLKESLLGFERRIKHLDGEIITITREGVTPPGFVQSIEDQGMPHYEYASERGKLFVEYHIAYPHKLNEKQIQ
ncbi:ATPase of 26S proteasome regulatory subunit 4, partial [Clydaea vesicula]